MFGYGKSECNGCLALEPETIATVARMAVAPSSAKELIYDALIKDIKSSQGLCLGVNSLHLRFLTIYLRASHDKQASLLDWTRNEFDGSEIGTIRFTEDRGVGGKVTGGNSYIKENYSQIQDYFSTSSKFGGYISADYNNRITGFGTTSGGAGAAEMSLSPILGMRIYDSWGTSRQWFTTAGAGMREIERGGTYFNGGFGGNRTLLYNGIEDLFVSPQTSTFRANFQLNFYSLATNSAPNGGTFPIIGNPTGINTVGLLMFQFAGSRVINSPRLLIAVEKYLKIIGAI